jgi:hypothetical protein
MERKGRGGSERRKDSSIGGEVGRDGDGECCYFSQHWHFDCILILQHFLLAAWNLYVTDIAIGENFVPRCRYTHDTSCAT